MTEALQFPDEKNEPGSEISPPSSPMATISICIVLIEFPIFRTIVSRVTVPPGDGRGPPSLQYLNSVVISVPMRNCTSRLFVHPSQQGTLRNHGGIEKGKSPTTEGEDIVNSVQINCPGDILYSLPISGEDS